MKKTHHHDAASRPVATQPYGSPDLRRLRVGRYRVPSEITQDAIAVWRIARSTAS